MSSEDEDHTPFHVLHKVPAGDGLYVRAKHVQLVDRDPDRAIDLFKAAIESGDRVDSALKDMAIVLKQQNRSEEAITAVAHYRSFCSLQAQESLDNVLLDLYKSSNRLDDQIALLIKKLKLFNTGQAFNGKRTKTARSQGKKFQVSVEQEASRLLGNLGWAYMQKYNYVAAESAYRKALALEVDNNKVCNLGVCLIKQNRWEEAIAVLRGVSSLNGRNRGNPESHFKSYERAQELIKQASAMLVPHRADQAVQTISVTDKHHNYHEDATGSSVNNDVRFNMSRLVEAACIIASNRKHDEDGNKQITTDGTEHDECLSGIDINANTIHGSGMSTSYLRQVHARRRLPVFQDLTLLGSAAA